jgi:hypothetical protein
LIPAATAEKEKPFIIMIKSGMVLDDRFLSNAAGPSRHGSRREAIRPGLVRG